MSINQLKQEVKELKNRVKPEPTPTIIIQIGIPDKLKFYNDLIANPSNKFMKEPNHPFHSYESFSQYNKDDLEEIVIHGSS